MIAFGIAILAICLMNLAFNAVLLFHLGRLVAVVEVKDPNKVADVTQPPRLVTIKRPSDTRVTQDAGKHARKVVDDTIDINQMSDSDIDKALKSLEAN